jgi:tellurite resistance protein
MPAPQALDPQEALVCTMVLVAAADGGLTDREIGAMAGLVQTLPIFHEFSAERLKVATDTAVTLLGETEGLNHAARLICEALEPRLRETAYALACDVIAADHRARHTELEMLAFVREQFEIDPLIAHALERAARARQQRP